MPGYSIPTTYDNLINQSAAKSGVDPHLLRGLLMSESGMDPTAYNGKYGAAGIGQFIPSTQKQVGLKNPYDPNEAIPAAAALLRRFADQANGDPTLAISLYKGVANAKERGADYPGTQKALQYAEESRAHAALTGQQNYPQAFTQAQPAQDQYAQFGQPNSPTPVLSAFMGSGGDSASQPVAAPAVATEQPAQPPTSSTAAPQVVSAPVQTLQAPADATASSAASPAAAQDPVMAFLEAHGKGGAKQESDPVLAFLQSHGTSQQKTNTQEYTKPPVPDQNERHMADARSIGGVQPNTSAVTSTGHIDTDPMAAYGGVPANMRPASPALSPREIALQPSAIDKLTVGSLEGIVHGLSGYAAMPIAGLAGIVGSALPGPEGQGANFVEKVSNALTYQPKTSVGKTASQIADLPGIAINKGSEIAGSGAGYVAKALGASPQSQLALSSLVEAAIPMGLATVGGAKSLRSQSGIEKSITETKAPEPSPLATPAATAAMDTAATKENGAVTALRNLVSSPKTEKVSPPMQERVVVGGGAATANSNPYPVLTGEEAARGPFPQVKLSKVQADVTPAEQNVRSAIANEILGENNNKQLRVGVVTGNENALRDEYSAAKSPATTPTTDAMKAQIAREQQALSDYAQKRIEATGANPTIATNEERGRIINDAFYGPDDSLKSYMRDAKRQIYDQAHAQYGDNPIPTNNVADLLASPEFEAGAKLRGNESTVRGAQALIDLARERGFDDPLSGQHLPAGSVAAWDAVRKSLNAEWSPNNANVIRQINGAIDRDMAAAGGNEAFKMGDAIHKAEKTLFESKGISTLLGDYDSNGVKAGAPLDSITSRLATMPLDQYRHIRDTLSELSQGRVRGAPEGIPDVPDSVRQSAASAIKEMDGALARKIYEEGANKAGVWNQNSVNKALNSTVGQKILETFPPDEVAKFHTLNYGGQIMPGVHSYEGAGMQLSRMAQPGFMDKYAPYGGAFAGHAIGAATGIPGAGFLTQIAGEKLGNAAVKKLQQRREIKQYQTVMSEMRRMSDLGRQQPQQ